MEIGIRRAGREDCPRLLELVKELATYEKAPQEVTVTLEHFTESGFGERPVWWAFVATISPANPGNISGTKEEIVGYALYDIGYSTWKGQVLYLEDILVTRSMRGKGVGKLLFDRLIQEAGEKKFNRIAWHVLDWNEPALNFYKKYNAEINPGVLMGSIYI